MSKKLIAIAFSDLHIHKFRNFNQNNSRLENSLAVLELMGIRANYAGVPVLFSGDLYHNPKELENETNTRTLKSYREYFEANKVHMYAISGNHDLSEKNGLESKSPSHLDGLEIFETFEKVDYKVVQTPNFIVAGLPYMNNDLELKQAVINLKSKIKVHKKFKGLRILLLHSDAPGAVTPEGIEIAETEHIPRDLDGFFSDWDLVLFGHIHKPQKLSNKCYMLGSPIHQTAGDEGIEMGYWEIYSDGSMYFKHLGEYPQFKTLKKGEQPSNEIDYWIYPEQILADENVEVGEFSLNNSRKKLAKKYCKVKGINDKSKLRILIKYLNHSE